MSITCKDIYDLIRLAEAAKDKVDTRSEAGKKKAKHYGELAADLQNELTYIEIELHTDC